MVNFKSQVSVNLLDLKRHEDKDKAHVSTYGYSRRIESVQRKTHDFRF